MPLEVRTGAVLAGFRVESLLGDGAMGSVFTTSRCRSSFALGASGSPSALRQSNGGRLPSSVRRDARARLKEQPDPRLLAECNPISADPKKGSGA